jgi:hypothetical protein
MPNFRTTTTSIHFGRGEAGTAMMEFVIVLPFILTMIFGVVDLGRAIAQYMMLSEVVSQGVRYAGSVSNLTDATTEFADLTNGQHCGAHKTKAVSKGSQATDNEIHQQIQQRVEDLLAQGNASIDNDTLCVRSKLEKVAGSTEYNIHLEVQAGFNSILPMFNGIILRAQATGPYLFPTI